MYILFSKYAIHRGSTPTNLVGEAGRISSRLHLRTPVRASRQVRPDFFGFVSHELMLPHRCKMARNCLVRKEGVLPIMTELGPVLTVFTTKMSYVICTCPYKARGSSRSPLSDFLNGQFLTPLCFESYNPFQSYWVNWRYNWDTQ
jgi:hypothetical protein